MRTLLIAALLILSACSPVDEDIGVFIDKTKREAIGRITPIPQQSIPVMDNFVLLGRDPFVLPKKFQTPKSSAVRRGTGGPNLQRQRGPLEQYALTDLQFVGTLGAGKRGLALIQTPDGTVHKTASGDYIGEHHGRVHNIRDGSLKLTEWRGDSFAGWRQQTQTLTLSNGTQQRAPRGKY